jgi:hypothetical protein
VGGILISGPGAASINGAAAFFVIGGGHHLFMYTSAQGYSMQSEYCNGHPAAATYLAVTYFACQGLDRSLWTKSFNGTTWTGSISLGGLMVDGPGVAAGPSGPTYFVEGLDRTVWERSPTAWTNDAGQVNYGVGAAYIP